MRFPFTIADPAAESVLPTSSLENIVSASARSSPASVVTINGRGPKNAYGFVFEMIAKYA